MILKLISLGVTVRLKYFWNLVDRNHNSFSIHRSSDANWINVGSYATKLKQFNNNYKIIIISSVVNCSAHFTNTVKTKYNAY